jgi:hypothetical protein
MSIVNINVSVLYSSSGSNSKNSVNLTYTPDSKKKFNSSSSIQNNTVINNINNSTGQNANKINNSSNSNNSNKSDNIKDVINKRKIMIEKQRERELIIKENIKKITIENLENNLSKHIETADYSLELLDIVKDFEVINHSHTKNNSNVKITNITNYILGPKSFDINTKTNEMMLRDIKSLNFITKKALSTNSKQNPIDSMDHDRRSFCKFQNIKTKKALFIDDNSEFTDNLHSESKKDNNLNSFAFSNNNSRDESRDREKERQIINIININNNYNIANIDIPIVEKNKYDINNFYSFSNSQKCQKSFKNMSMNNYKKIVSKDTNAEITPNQTPTQTPKQEFGKISNKTIRKLIPKNVSSGSKDFSNFGNNKSIREILSTVKKDQSNQKYIKLSK